MSIEMEFPQPPGYTLCPWKRIDEKPLDVWVCIRLKDHRGGHMYSPTVHRKGLAK